MNFPTKEGIGDFYWIAGMSTRGLRIKIKSCKKISERDAPDPHWEKMIYLMEKELVRRESSIEYLEKNLDLE